MMEIDGTTGHLDINESLLRAHTDLWLPTGFRTYVLSVNHCPFVV